VIAASGGKADWRRMQVIGAALVGVAAFWQMTPMEFSAVIAAAAAGGYGAATEPMRREDYQQLKTHLESANNDRHNQYQRGAIG
jgi:glycerate kinase